MEENNKSLLRKSVIEQRSSLSEAELEDKSRHIINTVKELEQFTAGNMIMCYVDFRNEVRTAGFIRECLLMGKRIAVPVVQRLPDKERSIIASEILDIDKDLEKGAYGILEPSKCKIREISPDIIDFVIVPGVVFDEAKNRIGYGAGYYDRFLPLVRNSCLKAGIAFELQIRPSIPAGRYDVPLDMIITEDRIIK